MKTIIINRNNDAYQIIHSLKNNRVKRKKYSRIVIEGVLPINLCLKYGLEIESIIIQRNKNLSDWADSIIKNVTYDYLYVMEESLMNGLSDKDETSELIVIARYPETTIDRFDYTNFKKIVLIDRPSNYGNLGTIIRSCDAFKIDAVLLSGHGVDPFNQKCISSSRGTIFSIPVIQIQSNNELTGVIQRLKEKHSQLMVIGSSAKGTSDLANLNHENGYILIIGNETFGMNDFLKSVSDIVVSIQMHGDASSLNVACAASIMLYELNRDVK